VLKRRLLRSSLLLLPAALLPWLQLGRGGEVATADSSRVFFRWGAPPTPTPTKMELLCTPLERALHLRVAFRVGLPPPLSPPARHFLVEHRQPYLFPTRWAAVGARAGPIPGPRMQMTKGMRVRVVTDPVARGCTALRELALGVRAELGKDAVGRAPRVSLWPGTSNPLFPSRARTWRWRVAELALPGVPPRGCGSPRGRSHSAGGVAGLLDVATSWGPNERGAA